jgi:hypothetical protein
VQPERNSSILHHYIQVSHWEGEIPEELLALDQEFQLLRSSIGQAEVREGNKRLGKTEKIGEESANFVLVGALAVVLNLCETGRLLDSDPRLQRPGPRAVVNDYLRGYFNIATRLMAVIGQPISDRELMLKINDQVKYLHGLSFGETIAQQREVWESWNF